MIVKTELITKVWEKVNIGRVGYKERLRKADIEEIINTMFDEMTECMIEGVDIRIDGFGKFSSNIRKRRVGVNPKTQEPLIYPERRVIKFDVSVVTDKKIKGDKKFERIHE